MQTTLRCLGTLAAALLCATVVVGACGGDDDSAQSPPTTDDGGGSDGGGTADGGGDDNGGGDNGGNGGGGAPGAPIDIPSFQQDQGRPLNDVLADIEGTVRAQCGELCIEIRVEMTDDGRTQCTFVATDPPQGSQVERGGTLRVIAGTQPCEDEGTDNEETDGGGTDNEETDGAGTDNGNGEEAP